MDRAHARRRAVGGRHARTAQPHRRLVVPRPRHDRGDRCRGGRRGKSTVRLARRREPRRVGGRVRDRRRGGRRHRADAGRVRRLLRGAHEVVGRPALGGHPDRSDAGAARRPVRAGVVRHAARSVVAALGPPARCADPRPADRARHHRAAHRRGPCRVVARRRRDRGGRPGDRAVAAVDRPHRRPGAGRRSVGGRVDLVVAARTARRRRRGVGPRRRDRAVARAETAAGRVAGALRPARPRRSAVGSVGVAEPAGAGEGRPRRRARGGRRVRGRVRHADHQVVAGRDGFVRRRGVDRRQPRHCGRRRGGRVPPGRYAPADAGGAADVRSGDDGHGPCRRPRRAVAAGAGRRPRAAVRQRDR